MNICSVFITGMIVVLTHGAISQVGINTTGAEPNPHAMLDVSSSGKGFLPPRLTTTERDAMTGEIPAGLTIYNVTTNCLNFYNGSAWQEQCGGSQGGIPSYTQAEINALETYAGLTVYNSTSGCLNYYNGTRWLESCGSIPATQYPNANEAYWAQRTLGFNPVSIGGGSVVYTYDATNKYYRNGTDILIPNKVTGPNGQTVSSFSFYGLSGGSANANNYQWDGATVLAQPNAYDRGKMFVSPVSSNIMTYCQALGQTTNCGSVTISAPTPTLAYPSASPGSGTYDLAAGAEQINAGNIKGTGNNQFISQQQLDPSGTQSYCVATYGKGWRMPTDVETGHANDNEGQWGSIQPGYQAAGPEVWIWTTTRTSTGTNTRWTMSNNNGWYRTGGVPVITGSWTQTRCVFSAE
jgi:hypothetical protein